jgi:3-oxoacyl-[acyl-carrier-protein] synthase-1
MSAAQGCASIRAGITRISLHASYRCIPPSEDMNVEEDANVLRAGVVPGLESDLEGSQRLLHLALPALQGLFADSKLSRADIREGALLLALPLPDPVVSGWALSQRFARELFRRSGLGDWGEVVTLEAGAAGVLTLVEQARALLTNRRLRFCVLLALDSYLPVDRLDWLDTARRLRSPRNVDGFIPGEAACALLLEHRRTAEARGVPLRGVVGPVASGTEPATVDSGRWSTGAGLCQALRPLLRSEGGEAIGEWTLCNLNGESYRAREWGLVQARLAKSLKAARKLQHPADRMGDAGTAMTAILMASACHAFSRNHAPAPIALVWVTSDDSARAALLLRAAHAVP